MEYSYQNSVIAQILEAIINASTYEGETGSNIADILLSILNETPYEGEANSVLAELFLELKAKIEGDPFTPYEGTYSGHIAEILLSILNETEYTAEPQSRIAELLLQLKEELETYTEVTVSGAIANFETNVSKPLVNLTAYVKATQEAGTPTPQSPKAISGINVVNVVHCHKNIFDYDESKVTTGETTSATTRAYYPLNLDNCTLTFTARLKDGATPLSEFLNIGQIRETDGLIGVRDSFLTPTGITTRTLQFSKGNKAVFVCSTARLDLTKSVFEKYDIQIEVSSNASDFEPYAGTTTLINLGGTYYGGYVTQDKNGHRQFVITWASSDLGTWTWYKATSGGITRFTGYPPTPNKLVKPKTATDSERQSLKCSIYSVSNTLSGSWDVTLSSNYSCVLSYSQGTDYIAIRNDDYTSEADFKTAMNGVIMFYKMQEQYYTIIDLPDGEPITAFNGVNNIYNDSGDTSVTYLYKGEPPLQSPLGFGFGSSNSDPEEENIEEDTPIEETENSEEET